MEDGVHAAAALTSSAILIVGFRVMIGGWGESELEQRMDPSCKGFATEDETADETANLS